MSGPAARDKTLVRARHARPWEAVQAAGAPGEAVSPASPP